MRILAIFCFHNRRAKTTAMVQSLLSQNGIHQEFTLQMLALDDGSSDNSHQAILDLEPSATIYKADGSWFWARSMAFLWSQSQGFSVDFVLLLNDDVLLDSSAIINTLQDFKELKQKHTDLPVLVGKTRDAITDQWTYGGHWSRHALFPLWFKPGNPGEGMVPVHTFNANFVLIPSGYVQRFSLDHRYSHAFADIDLGLQMHRQAIPLYQCKHYVGTCSRNSKQGTWMDSSLSAWERIKKINTRKGMPVVDRMRYAMRNGGWAWPYFWLHPYLKFLISLIRR